MACTARFALATCGPEMAAEGVGRSEVPGASLDAPAVHAAPAAAMAALMAALAARDAHRAFTDGPLPPGGTPPRARHMLIIVAVPPAVAAATTAFLAINSAHLELMAAVKAASAPLDRGAPASWFALFLHLASSGAPMVRLT